MKTAIVYASDGRDLRLCTMSIHSVRLFLPDLAHDIFLLTERQDIILPGVTIINPAHALDSVGFFPDRWDRHWPYATLYRLVMPLLPELSKYDRVIYLDTDTLVRSEEAKILSTMSIGKYEILGARDNADFWDRNNVAMREVPSHAAVVLREHIWDKNGVQARAYCNAGVTLWNLLQIRCNGLDWYKKRLKWFWEGETSGKFNYLDQDFINIFMDIDPCLSSRFNWFADRDIPAGCSCVIHHFYFKYKYKMEPEAVKLGWADPAETLDASSKTNIPSVDGK